MRIERNKTKEFVRFAFCKKAHRVFDTAIDRRHPLQRIQIKRRLKIIDIGCKGAFIPKVNRLRRNVEPVAKACRQGIGRQEMGKERSEIKKQNHHPARHGGAVAHKFAPHELPLGQRVALGILGACAVNIFRFGVALLL